MSLKNVFSLESVQLCILQSAYQLSLHLGKASGRKITKEWDELAQDLCQTDLFVSHNISIQGPALMKKMNNILEAKRIFFFENGNTSSLPTDLDGFESIDNTSEINALSYKMLLEIKAAEVKKELEEGEGLQKKKKMKLIEDFNLDKVEILEANVSSKSIEIESVSEFNNSSILSSKKKITNYEDDNQAKFVEAFSSFVNSKNNYMGKDIELREKNLNLQYMMFESNEKDKTIIREKDVQMLELLKLALGKLK